MKRFFVLSATLLLVALLALTLAACGEEATTTAPQTTEAPVTTTPETKAELVNGLPTIVDGKLFIIEDGKTNYRVTFSQGANNKTSPAGKSFSNSLSALRKAFKAYGYGSVSIMNDAIPLGQEDTFVAPEFEILLGDTNREESNISTDDLGFNQARICVKGKKVIIKGKSNSLTALAVMEFIDRYMPQDGTAVWLPTDLDEVLTVNFTECIATNKSYAEMARDVLNSFNEVYFTETGIYTDFWHMAEMLETYVDVYEYTKSKEDKDNLMAFANGFLQTRGGSWLGNMYNDDIMWICIAFSRITQLTGEAKYARFAKSNFDQVWKRAWDTKLGGGLYWTTDNNSKNACVNGPAAIAACLIGDIYDDESYFEKAKQIMEWEIKWLYDAKTGNVYDAMNIQGGVSKWASTYNQGTFIGACTLLYKHYNDETYLNHAGKAAEYAMVKLTNDGVLDNGEDSGNDLPGFKGILTRWLYRYAKEVESIDILVFLQNNAAVAYQNQNKDGLIWTKWVDKTSDDASGYLIFGLSTAISLMYNCQQWW